MIPPGSLLAKWQAATGAAEKEKLAQEVERLLASTAPDKKDSPDAVLHRQLTSLGGPLFNNQMRSLRREETSTETRNPKPASAASEVGLDPAQFGKHPNGSSLDSESLCLQAPSVVEIRLPADLMAGYEFVTTGTLDKATGAEGSVQLQVLTNKPSLGTGLLTIEAKTADGEGPEVAFVQSVFGHHLLTRRDDLVGTVR